MSDAELYGMLTEGLDIILAIISIYFSILSAYIAALFYFLRHSPFTLKLAAFAVLSGALAFIGMVIIGVERLIASVLYALRERAPIYDAPQLTLYMGVDLNELAQMAYPLAVAAGWALAVLLYTALFYLTFVHRWPPKNG